MSKLKIDRLIIVEGKYDKVRLENIVDAPIIDINGFNIFKDEKLKDTLKSLSENGVIVLTDSDTAGYRIRVYLSKILGGDKITDVFVPQIPGKECRKRAASAEGYLGVEGISDDVLKDCLKNYCSGNPMRSDIDTADLYELGYIGRPGSRQKKNALLKHLGVQSNISNKFLLKIINQKYTRAEFADLQKDDI